MSIWFICAQMPVQCRLLIEQYSPKMLFGQERVIEKSLHSQEVRCVLQSAVNHGKHVQSIMVNMLECGLFD